MPKHQNKIQPRRNNLSTALLIALLLNGCSMLGTKSEKTKPTTPDSAAASATKPTTPPVRYELSQIVQAARFEDLPGWATDDLRATWPGFLQSCKTMTAKASGAPWKRVCEIAKNIDGSDADAVRAFYEGRLSPYALVNPETQSNDGLITGYYEPLLRGSRKQDGAFQTPVLAVPTDLLTIELGDLVPELKNMRLRGRLEGNKVVPYASRNDIVGQTGYRAGKDKVLLWVDDAVELFFLQIQGSGRVKLPDGNMVRLGYADQNGHPYRSVGRVLIDRGELKAEEASMQGIQGWARKNPAKLNELLSTNPSYVFFRELPANPNPDLGPPGAQGIPLTPERSIAIDPKSTPLGVPVYLSTTKPNSSEPLNRLMLAQDTGGAIRGVVRADFFWGFGPAAGEQAGKMKQSGRMWLLLPPEAAPR
jgi:membrane-bound lytic murein transglycosylase A